MPRPSALLAIFLALFACSASTPASPPPPPVDWRAFSVKAPPDASAKVLTAKERDVAEAYVGALTSPDFAKLRPMLDEDVRSTFPGQEDAHGRDAAVHAHDGLFGAL